MVIKLVFGRSIVLTALYGSDCWLIKKIKSRG